MNTKEVIKNNKATNTNKQKHLKIDGVTAFFKNGEELGVVSGFDVVSGKDVGAGLILSLWL